MTDQPRYADAIVVLSGASGRRQVGVALARAAVAPVLVLSTPSLLSTAGIVAGAGAPPGVEVIPFSPSPSSTQGEARFVGRLARRRGWRRVVVVAGRSQATRARIRFERCFPGQVSVVGAPEPTSQLPYRITYEWAALAKAVLWQRSC